MQAANACLRFGDMGGVAVDISAAMTLAQAQGVPAQIAGPLIAACAEGLLVGVNDRRGDSTE